MKELICRLFGHRMDIVGVAGAYVWCSRCGHKRMTPGGINSALRGIMAELRRQQQSPKPYFWLGAEAEALSKVEAE